MLSEVLSELRQHFDVKDLNDGNGYCVFGTVVKGADVVDKIAAVRTTTRRGMNDVPVDVVKILDVKVLP